MLIILFYVLKRCFLRSLWVDRPSLSVSFRSGQMRCGQCSVPGNIFHNYIQIVCSLYVVLFMQKNIIRQVSVVLVVSIISFVIGCLLALITKRHLLERIIFGVWGYDLPEKKWRNRFSQALSGIFSEKNVKIFSYMYFC